MPTSEKSFLEKIAQAIPGVAGYRDREARRETDRRLREYLSRRIEEGRGELDALRLALTGAGDLRPLSAVGELDRLLQKVAASLRYADAGYSGFFDTVKIREEELDRICAYDEALLGEVQGLSDAIREVSAARKPEEVAGLIRRTERLEERVSRRRELFHTPSD